MDSIRKRYIAKLDAHKNNGLVKVLSGMRRSGKSTIMHQFQKHLLKSGVSKKQIISVNFEDITNEQLKEYHKLNEYVLDRVFDDEMIFYVFLDEIQEVDEFEKVINSLHLRKNIDIYITGSNAYFLSGEFATYLSGRYIQIDVFPLSLAEFRQSYPALEKFDLYNHYIYQGGMPYFINSEYSSTLASEYLDAVYNTVLIKDIVTRKNISEVSLLRDVTKFLAGNIGSLNSIKRIADTITSFGRKVSTHTVESYISGLTDALLFHKVERYDIKGKQHLKTGAKYYICDIGFRNFILKKTNIDFGFILENLVYLELKRRNLSVMVGKIGDKEVDFVVTTPENQTKYYQVAYTIKDEQTFEREVSALQSVKENYEKTILHLDIAPKTDYNGIVIQNAIDWLLGADELERNRS